MESVIRTSSDTLNQKAKRPPKTGFDLSKSRSELGYTPLSFEEALMRLEKELTINNHKS